MPQRDGCPGDAVLCARLDEIATRLRQQAYPLAYIVYTAYGAGFDADEFSTLSLSSAFLAFTTLGGDVDHPEAFAWDEQREALHRVGLTYLRTDLGGRHTVFGDAELRNRTRREFADVEALSWAAWVGCDRALPCQPETGKVLRNRTRRGKPLHHTPGQHGVRDTPVDHAFETSTLLELDTALRSVLTPKEYTLLAAHYFQGVPQRLLAEQLAASDTNYHDVGGVKRAEKMVNKVLSRARAKLERMLPPQWRALSEEVG